MWFSKLKPTENWTWLCFCLSIFFLPLFPAIGVLGLLISLGKVYRDNFSSISSNILSKSFGLLAVILIISTIQAEYPQEAWLGLANFLPFFLVFTGFRYLITKLKQLQQLSWLLILPSLPIVLLGLGQMFFAWNTPLFLESIVGWQLVPLGVPPGRMSSVFIYTNFLAIYLAIAFTLTFGLWLDTWQSKSVNQKFCFLLMIVLLADISGLILTSSRNAWIIAVCSFMAYAFYFGWKWLILGVTSAASTVLWASFAPNWGGTQLRQFVPAFIWMRLSDQSYERPIETLRITQWQFCWDLIQNRPLFGWGLRNYTPLYESKHNIWLGHPHNLFLMFGAEAGMIAAILLIIIVAVIMFNAIQSIKYGLSQEFRLIEFSYLVAFSGIILFNLADVSIFDLRINILTWILLAAISGVSSQNLVTRKLNKPNSES